MIVQRVEKQMEVVNFPLYNSMEVNCSDLIYLWMILAQNELVQNRACTDKIFR